MLFSLVRLWTIRCLLVQVGTLKPSRKRLKTYDLAWQTPRQEMWLECRWSELSGWLTSYPEEMILRIWGFGKDVELTFDRLIARLVFSDLIKADQSGSRPAEMSWDLKYHKMRRARVVVVVGGVSIVWLA